MPGLVSVFRKRPLPFLLLAAGALLLAYLLWSRPEATPVAGSARPEGPAPGEPAGDRPRDPGWDRMVRSEELIMSLTPDLQRLAFAVENLELPDGRTRSLFASPEVSVADLAPEAFAGEARERLPWVGAVLREGRVAGARPVATEALRLWRGVLDETEWFQHASFKFLRGGFVDAPAEPGAEEYEAEVIFSGLARLRDRGWISLATTQRVRWRQLAAPGEDEVWRIVRWHTEEATRQEVPRLMFREVLGEALRDPGVLERARESIHERKVHDFLTANAKDGKAKRPTFFTLPSWARHPGVAVVDLDRDGWDDLYLMARWGPNQFFRNRGDGSFEEIAADLGIAVDGRSSSAIFADFDNDGDADLFLGRTLSPSQYLENRDGRFVERGGQGLPHLASSVTAVDYDRDGLLDVYVSTYGASVMHKMQRLARKRGLSDVELLRRLPFLRLEEFRKVQALNRQPDHHGVLKVAGPPNVLLRNLGAGRFQRVEGSALESYRNTYQAAWADYDDDGDPDVYLANDFEADQLFRNEGEGRFTDVSAEAVEGDFGLAMGATWADYDRDGRQDLYVTNMYSKAGNRILAQLPSVDTRLKQAATGNFLFRNEGDGLRQVSGDDPGQLHVSHGGWGWGALFRDVDNDGFPDLFSLSGYYTAPRSVTAAADT